jgi:hypothetical protein
MLSGVLIGTLLLGCSSQYRPRSSSRLSVTMEGGAPSYVRDGKDYSPGLFGGGLVDAVSDDPEARAAAETYQSRTVTGFVLVLVGTACAIGGMILVLPDAADTDQSDRDSTRTGLGAGALACAAGGLIAGSVLVMTGAPYQWDAINIYNDHAEERMLRRMAVPIPGYAPGVVPPGVVPPSGIPQPAPPAPPPATIPPAPPAPAPQPE